MSPIADLSKTALACAAVGLFGAGTYADQRASASAAEHAAASAGLHAGASGDQSAAKPAPGSVSAHREKPKLYPRTAPFWTSVSGPRYGQAPAELSDSPDLIVSRVGSFLTNGDGLKLPDGLKASDPPVGIAYFIVQLRAEEFAPLRRDAALKLLSGAGAQIIDSVPNHAYIVRVDPSSAAAVRSLGIVQFVGPYQPAYKIAPDLGTAPLSDPERAASPIYSLVVTGFPG